MVAQEPVTLTLVAVNDFHGAIYASPHRDEPDRAYGGLPWLVGAVEHLRDESPNVVVLDGGDQFQGAWPVNATLGLGAVQAYNLLGADAAAVGNHEFDYGGLEEGGHPLRGAFERAALQADYAWLSANVFQVDGSRWQPEGVHPWTIIERAGVRLGVIGLTTTDTPSATLSKNVADLEFRDVVGTVAELAPMLREEQDADVIVVVGHLTGECDPEGFADPGEPCSPADTEIGRLLDLCYTLDDPRMRSNVAVYLARPVAGALRAADDASDAAFFSLDELPENVAFENNKIILRRLLREFPTGDIE